MKFGVAPTPLEQDKVYNQPCFLTQVGGWARWVGGQLDGPT